MNLINKHFDKENLHHAYLVEGAREEITKSILEFLKIFDISPSSPDLVHIAIDNFKIDEAFSLKDMSSERGIGEKKFFIICANNFSLDAQGTMLKLFEEPIENTHFFLVVPDVNALLPTLVSRFYVISADDKKGDIALGEKFIKLSLRGRIDFLKELLVEPENEIMDDSIRSKALKFLNTLELALHAPHRKFLWGKESVRVFEQIMKARQFLRQSGSSPKTLIESVALLIPEKL